MSRKDIPVILILSVAAACVAGHTGVMCASGKAATEQDLERVRQELKAQIDSILRNQDSIKHEIRAVKGDTDTLKAGQEAIFRTMKENEGKTLWDYFFK